MESERIFDAQERRMTDFIRAALLEILLPQIGEAEREIVIQIV